MMSTAAEEQKNPFEYGDSLPIPTLHDAIPVPALTDLWVEPCSFQEAAAFVVLHHYTHSAKGMTPEYCYRVVDRVWETVVGAAIFGIPGQAQTTRKYSEDGTIKMVELRRFVLLDQCPRTSESRVLSIMFRLLRKEGVQRILSYADPNQKRSLHPDGKHTGLIYRATGFHQVKEAGKTKAIWFEGRRYPIRNIDQYNNYHAKLPGWDAIPDNPKPKLHRVEKCPKTKKNPVGRRDVWIVKSPEERIAINKKLRAALAEGTAAYQCEEGKIGYVKDLEKGMPYFDTPTPKRDAVTAKTRRRPNVVTS